MRNEEIKILLKKYFEGESSLHDEKILRHYFLFENITPDLQEYKILFTALESESKIISEPITEDLFIKEAVKTIPFTRNSTWAIAATVLILIGTWFLLNQQKPKQKIPSSQELLMAEKYLNMGFHSFHKAYQKTNRLLEETKILQLKSQQALKAGLVYEKNTKGITNLNYINQSLGKLQNISKLKKSRIKLIM